MIVFSAIVVMFIILCQTYMSLDIQYLFTISTEEYIFGTKRLNFYATY